MAGQSSKVLLAKSYSRKDYPQAPPDFARLTQHSRDVADACLALAEISGQAALGAAYLSDQIGRFRLALLVNGWLQDLGKANDHFQDMVWDPNNAGAQLLRHETISGLLVWQNIAGIRDWLKPIEDVLILALWGAIGHHRKFDESTEPAEVYLLTVHLPKARTILEEMGKSIDSLLAKSEHPEIRLGSPPPFAKEVIVGKRESDGGDIAAGKALSAMQTEFQRREADFSDPRERRLLALIKVFGIAADVCASAVARRGVLARNYSVTGFVNKALSVGLKLEHFDRIIAEWAWNQIKEEDDLRRPLDLDQLPPGFGIRPFQQAVADSQSYLTLAEAGCGTGKSRAAYEWAKAWCGRLNRSNFRLFFCLPTTGTTTEHYKDYALLSGIPAELAHMRASVDLKTMSEELDEIAETMAQEDTERDQVSDVRQAAGEALRAMQDKIEALSMWESPLVVTTTDTVLGLMANARRAVYTSPAIFQSAVVFDEIHAFDDNLFGHLLVFLENFPRIPVLLMTASLPKARHDAIRERRPDLLPIPGPTGPETASRYRIKYPADEDETRQSVEQVIRDKGKILWVRNQVEWANQTYEQCCERFPDAQIEVYHSRLRYKDRSRRHRKVIDDFKNRKGKPKAIILVTTQVAEMSLNLSADLLVTDLAPVPSLIQRMGRLNRVPNPTEAKDMHVHQLPVGKAGLLPYDQAELEQAEHWLASLGKQQRQPLNQQDLSKHFADLSKPENNNRTKANQNACFLSGLWRTRVGETRGKGYTVSVILEPDLKALRKLGRKPDRDWLRENEVAIPYKDPIRRWERVSGLPIAPANEVDYNYDDYTHEGTGARWL